MKVGILTFHCVHNYGAILQAYALQEYIKSLGHEAYIIDYRPKYLLEPYAIFSKDRFVGLSVLRKIIYGIRELVVLPIRVKRWYNFNRFVKSYLRLRDFCHLQNDIDVYVFGSDQIWNPIISHGIDPVFVGNFSTSNNKAKIAYAASLGSLKHLSKNDEETLFSGLANFSSISCRENSLSEYLSKNIRCRVETVVDPVLLVGKPIFDQIMHKVDKRHPYLLFFTLSHNAQAQSIAYRYAKEQGLDIVEIVSFQISAFNFRTKQAVSVERLLGYIAAADFIVTTSFHGTALSVLYNKEFVYFADNPQVGERSTDLLKSIGLDNRVIDKDNNDLSFDPIDYTKVQIQLDAACSHSKNFILRSLLCHSSQ